MIWALVALASLATLAALAGPFHVAWRCVARHASGERVEATLVGKEEAIGLALQIASGSRAGESCTVRVPVAEFEAAALGDRFAVVLPAHAPECLLEADLEAAEGMLQALAAATAALLLVYVLAGISISRAFAQAPELTTRLDVDPEGVRCPRCGKPMGEGYLPLLSGLHWRGPGQPVGMPHAIGGLPGTFGWRRRPRVHAFRCEPCEVVTFRYGR